MIRKLSATQVLWFVAWPLMIAILQTRYLGDVDLFTQVKLGLLSFAQGSQVATDPFTFTHFGEPFPAVGHLAQSVFAAAYTIGGWPVVQMTHILLFSLGLVLAAHAAILRCNRSGISLRGITVIVGCILATLVVYTNSAVRPQSFAVFAFGANLLLLESSFSLPKKILLIGLLLVGWQNAHLSGMLWIFFLAATGLSLIFVSPAQPIRRREVGVLFMLGLPLLFLNPLGTGVFSFSTKNSYLSRDLLRISEWLAPWDPAARAGFSMFLIVIVLSALLAIRYRRSIPRDERAAVLLFTVLSLHAGRFSLFWTLVLFPIWFRTLEQLLPPSLFPTRAAVEKIRLRLAIPLIAFLLIVPPLLRGDQLIDPRVPVKDLEQLRNQFPEAKIYNYREWGGPLSFVGYPGWKILIDGRLYLFSVDEWRKYQQIALGEVPVKEIREKYGVNLAVLHPGYHRRLIPLFEQSPDWTRIPTSKKLAVFSVR